MIGSRRGLALLIISASFWMQPLSARPRPVMIIDIRGIEPNSCEMSVSGGPYLPSEAFSAVLQTLKREQPRAEIHIGSKIDTPWRCVGNAMAVAAEAGFRRVGFISQPALAE